MNGREKRSLQSFKDQVGHVRKNGLHTKARQVEVHCAKLEQFVPRLERIAADILGLAKSARKGETVLLWRKRLLNKSLRPLRDDAEEYLQLELTVPNSDARNDELVAAGLEFEQKLRLHLDTLVANGCDDDCLDVLVNDTHQLKRWTTEASDDHLRLARLREEERDLLQRARRSAHRLHSAVLAVCEDEPQLLSDWNEARLIPKRIGPPRERGGHLKSESGKKRNRTPTGRPVEFNKPPVIPPRPPQDPPAA